MKTERVMPKTGHVVIPKGRDSSATKRVEIPSGAGKNNKPMTRGF